MLQMVDVSDSDGKIAQHTGYYPYGEPWSEPTGQPYLFGDKERLREGGLNEYDFGARRYNSALALWTTPDPLASKFGNINPYTYCAGNPIRYVDPSGLTLVLTGDDIESLINTINSRLNSVSISVNENGLVSYIQKSGKPKKANKYDKKLMEIMEDSKITVNATAQKSSDLDDGNYFYGGAFMGNTYDDENDEVNAYQVLNPSILNKLSKDNTKEEGQDIFHELTEAYACAKISLANKR